MNAPIAASPANVINEPTVTGDPFENTLPSPCDKTSPVPMIPNCHTSFGQRERMSSSGRNETDNAAVNVADNISIPNRPPDIPSASSPMIDTHTMPRASANQLSASTTGNHINGNRQSPIANAVPHAACVARAR